MDVDQFWGLIARSDQRRLDSEERAEWLTDRLAELPPGDIVDFQLHLDRLRAPLDTYRLWGAAYLICGGASDDGFWYFQLWVIGLGRAAYELALGDPDALAGLPVVRLIADSEDDELVPEWEGLEYAAEEAYEEATGEDLIADRGYEPRSGPDPEDESFDFGDEADMALRYPRLSVLFPEFELDPA